jgi:hypothetical protein
MSTEVVSIIRSAEPARTYDPPVCSAADVRKSAELLGPGTRQLHAGQKAILGPRVLIEDHILGLSVCRSASSGAGGHGLIRQQRGVGWPLGSNGLRRAWPDYTQTRKDAEGPR